MLPSMYTISELSEIIKVDRRCVTRLIHGRVMRAFKVGNSYRVSQEMLDEYIEANSNRMGNRERIAAESSHPE